MGALVCHAGLAAQLLPSLRVTNSMTCFLNMFRLHCCMGSEPPPPFYSSLPYRPNWFADFIAVAAEQCVKPAACQTILYPSPCTILYIPYTL